MQLHNLCTTNFALFAHGTLDGTPVTLTSLNFHSPPCVMTLSMATRYLMAGHSTSVGHPWDKISREIKRGLPSSFTNLKLLEYPVSLKYMSRSLVYWGVNSFRWIICFTSGDGLSLVIWDTLDSGCSFLLSFLPWYRIFTLYFKCNQLCVYMCILTWFWLSCDAVWCLSS